jgi:hypothetical protein
VAVDAEGIWLFVDAVAAGAAARVKAVTKVKVAITVAARL